MEPVIREFRFPEDFGKTLTLWDSVGPGVKVGPSDSLEEIGRKIGRDPDLFLLAEWDGRIIGSVIGGYDGRRGMIYHLAVDPLHRGRGLATRLMAEVESRLMAKGCLKCYLLVFADNTPAIEFYRRRGWSEMTEDRIFAKEFR